MCGPSPVAACSRVQRRWLPVPCDDARPGLAAAACCLSPEEASRGSSRRRGAGPGTRRTGNVFMLCVDIARRSPRELPVPEHAAAAGLTSSPHRHEGANDLLPAPSRACRSPSASRSRRRPAHHVPGVPYRAHQVQAPNMQGGRTAGQHDEIATTIWHDNRS